MKKLSIILSCFLVALAACTKSKEVHPEIGDGNDEIVTVGIKDVHVEYLRTDITELQKVVFHYGLAETQQFVAVEMTKCEDYFELTLTNLLSDTLYSYFYELFSIDGETSLTGKKIFHTQTMDTPEPPTPPTPPSDIPEGAINGLFTINENGDQVYFSKGNLQYDISNQTWSFMDYQYDIVEIDQQYVGENYANQNIVSLFGWGTSGWDNGNVYYQPWETIASELYGPPGINSLTGSYANSDWGLYNTISNGGNTVNQWRTMTMEEWQYALFNRRTITGIRYAKAVVNNINGVIILPDDWESSTYMLYDTNTSDVGFDGNSISASQWVALENEGAVFLPAAGFRSHDKAIHVGFFGRYWSSSCSNSQICFVSFDSHVVQLPTGGSRSLGRSVRLVQDANK